jgi:hypothetical protein
VQESGVERIEILDRFIGHLRMAVVFYDTRISTSSYVAETKMVSATLLCKLF